MLYETNYGIVRISDKQNDTTICCILLPDMIKQITENEFITIYPKEIGKDYVFLFQHIKYDNFTKKTNIIFEQEFKSKSSVLATYQEIDGIFIIEEYLRTTIYNAKNKKSLILEDSKITKLNDDDEKHYLKGVIDIEGKDILTMYIDKNTLEFEEFYSQEQGRIIPIIKEGNDFLTNYSSTLEKEVVKYLELLELYQEEYQKTRNKHAEQVLRNHLTKKKTKQ